MTKPNSDVAEHFVKSNITELKEVASKSLSADGHKVWSYGTVIAKKLTSGIVLVSRDSMTPTTGKHLSEVRCALGYKNPNVVFVPVEMYGDNITNEKITVKFKESLDYYLHHSEVLKRKPNRFEFKHLWKDALDFDSKVEPFLDDTEKIKIGRLISTMKQD